MFTNEEASERWAQVLIEAEGLEYHPQHNPRLLPGMRFCYRAPGVISPRTGVTPVGWGGSPLEAAFNIIASNKL
jgi:hypothetical protein